MTQHTKKTHEENGNTNHSPRCRRWCFTLNNPSEIEINKLKELFTQKCLSFIFQLEEGENKTPHLQGFIEFKNPTEFKTIKNFNERLHIEKCKNKEASIAYCSKKEGQLEKPIYKNIFIKEELKLIEENNLYDWQKKILNLIKTEPDDRSINWFWDEKGNIGKTQFAKFLCAKYNALYINGNSNDNKYLITQFIENNNLKIVIFDYCRTIENKISYQSLEEIKNGIFMNTKYECKMILFNSPHIIVFANYPPNTNELSLDRWKITQL